MATAEDEPRKIVTEDGTIFIVEGGLVTIIRSDQPACTLSLANMEEFLRLYFDE